MDQTILVVEDDSANRFLMETVLSSEGYAVVSSVDGSNALELARMHKPGLILMDINLPKVQAPLNTIPERTDLSQQASSKNEARTS